MPINISILKWARSSIGMSIKEVSSKIGRSEQEIRDWESGQATPTYPQLEKLAYSVYNRPIAVFFFPNIPEEDTPNTDFRALPQRITDKLPSEIIKLYRKSKIFQINLSELYSNARPVEAGLIEKFKIKNSDDAKIVASQVRDALGISLDDQYSWNSLDIAFKNWRKAVESLGIFVFKDAFRNNDYSGFCVYDIKYPIIYINNSMADSRQIFTLFHEVGHLLSHVGGVDFRDNRIFNDTSSRFRNYERICNVFASEFLVPNKEFHKYDLKVDDNRIAEIASKFSVSREVILRKYLDFGLVDTNFYYKLVDKWAGEHKKGTGGGNYYYNQKAYLGETYIDLVFGQYYKNRISIEKLSDYLNIKESNISTFEHFAFG